MLLLALDTSTRQASVALCTEQQLLGEYTWQVGNNHSVELLERIQRLFAECDTRLSALDAIAVANGPGSFNGVRVALTTAKSLAFALRKPLVGISTLDSIAAAHSDWPGPVCAILEAGRSELYVACYIFEQGDEGEQSEQDVMGSTRLRRLSDYQIQSPQEVGTFLREHLSEWLGVPGKRELPTVLLCGEISAASREALHTHITHIQQKHRFAGAIASSRHASALALLAMRRMQDGQMDDPLLLEPLYLRRPSITTSTRKQSLQSGAAGSSDTPGKSAQAAKKTGPTTGQSETEREEGALRH